MINPHRAAVGRALADAHGVDHVFVIGPDELHDIHPAVVVVIPPESRGSEALLGDTGLLADIGERAIAIVVVKLRAAQAVGEKQVGLPVVVVIAPGAADGGPDGVEPGLFGDFGERAVAVVVEEAVRRLAVEQAAEIIGDEQIEEAVAIVIDPGSGERRAPATSARPLR